MKSKPQTLRDVGEAGLIRWLSSRRAVAGRGVTLGIGDDAALISPARGLGLAVSCDAQVEGIHFRRAWQTPAGIGRRALAVNLSDMAAMGARPRWFICQAGLPGDTRLDFFEDCMNGMTAYARRTGVILVGGDLASSPGPFFLALTILGQVAAGRALTRRGARAGDLIVVSGWPGEAAAGLALLKRGRRRDDPDPSVRRLIRRHLEPEPRLALGWMASASGAVTACTDVSDGLSTDLIHLCEAGGVGAEVDASALPVSRALARAAPSGGKPLDFILGGGEDYELLMAVRPSALASFQVRARRLGGRVTAVGRFVAGPGVAHLVSGRARSPLGPSGFDHFGRRRSSGALRETSARLTPAGEPSGRGRSRKPRRKPSRR